MRSHYSLLNIEEASGPAVGAESKGGRVSNGESKKKRKNSSKSFAQCRSPHVTCSPPPLFSMPPRFVALRAAGTGAAGAGAAGAGAARAGEAGAEPALPCYCALPSQSYYAQPTPSYYVQPALTPLAPPALSYYSLPAPTYYAQSALVRSALAQPALAQPASSQQLLRAAVAELLRVGSELLRAAGAGIVTG